MTVWICSKCGMAGAQPSAARPAIDDRFAVGYCDCTPEPTFNAANKRHVISPPVRPVVPLVDSKHWDPATLERRRAAAAEAKFVRDFNDGKLKGAENAERMAAIRRRWDEEAQERRRVSAPSLPVPRSRA